MRITSTLATMAAGTLALALVAAPHAPAQTITPRSAPQISYVDPAMGGAGDVLEIGGRGFVNSGQPASVTFHRTSSDAGVRGTVQAGFTDERLTVTVPTITNPPAGFMELRITTSAGSDSAPFRYYSGKPGALSQPTSLAAKATKGKVTLRWMPPTTGASTVTAYEWTVSVKGTDRWAPWKKVAKGAQARSQVVKRIRPKTAYVFEVRAVAGSTQGPGARIEVRGK
jgi:hypothetical protein